MQILQEQSNQVDKLLYILLDNPYFQSVSLYDFAIEFESYGGIGTLREAFFVNQIKNTFAE